MEILKIVLLSIDGILSVMLIVLMLLQSDKSDGAGSAITGSSSSDGYLNNNMDRSKEATLRRVTIISGTAFMIITFVLGLLYIM